MGTKACRHPQGHGVVVTNAVLKGVSQQDWMDGPTVRTYPNGFLLVISNACSKLALNLCSHLTTADTQR